MVVSRVTYDPQVDGKRKDELCTRLRFAHRHESRGCFNFTYPEAGHPVY